MRRLGLLVVAGLALAGLVGAVAPAAAQPGYGFSTPPGVAIQDEAVAQGRARTLNCAGAGITCTVSTGVATLTVPGGSGAGNFAAATVDFGASGTTNASVVVIGQAWVTATSVIICAPTLFATASRADGAEDAILEQLVVGVSARVAGTGFTVHAGVQHGVGIGAYLIHCTGS